MLVKLEYKFFSSMEHALCALNSLMQMPIKEFAYLMYVEKTKF